MAPIPDPSLGWHYEQRILGAPSTSFGLHVALDGTTLVIGASGFDEPGTSAGIAAVYELRGQSWVLAQRIPGPSPEAYAIFGNGVGLCGDTLAIGAPGVDGPSVNSGALYVFQRDGGTFEFVHEARLPSVPGVVDLGYGSAYLSLGKVVAVDGNTIVAGAPGSYGAALVVERLHGAWQRTALLVDATPVNGDDFGCSVAVEGDLIVVGEPADRPGPPTRGAAFVFKRATTGDWLLDTELRASDGFAGGIRTDEFGRSVAIDDETIVVGSNNGNFNGNDSGTTYAFERDTSGVWCELERFVSTAPEQLSASLGTSVSLEDGFLVSGAVGTSIAGSTLRGAAYVFERVRSTEECPGDLNSTGSVAGLVVVGDSDSVTLSVRGLPSGASTIFFLGQASGSTITQPCLRPPFLRFPVGAAGPSGQAMMPLSLSKYPSNAVIHCQAWYFDPVNGGLFSTAAVVQLP